jgi:hypothetical protein
VKIDVRDYCVRKIIFKEIKMFYFAFCKYKNDLDELNENVALIM